MVWIYLLYINYVYIKKLINIIPPYTAAKTNYFLYLPKKSNKEWNKIKKINSQFIGSLYISSKNNVVENIHCRQIPTTVKQVLTTKAKYNTPLLSFPNQKQWLSA